MNFVAKRWWALGLAFAATAANSAQDLSLDEAIRVALARNRGLQTLRLALESSGVSLGSAWDEFAWTISPNGSAGVTEDGGSSSVGFDIRKKSTMGTQFSAGTSLADFGDRAVEPREGVVRVEARQPLFRGAGRLLNEEGIRRAESSLVSARRRLEDERANLIVRVVEQHQELARLQSQVVSDEQSLARYDQLSRLTRAREAQGRATRVDSLRTEFQRGRAELTLNTTRERLQSARADLADLLGVESDTDYVAISGPALELDPLAAGEAERVAFSNRLDYADALQTVRDARRGIRIARRNLWPTLDLVTRYEKSGRGDSVAGAYRLNDETWYVGLAGDADFPQRSDQAAAAKAQLDAAGAENQLASLVSSIRRQVQQALLAYQRAVKQIEFAARNHELAKDRARLARRLFEIGRSDNFTATDAEAELLQAEGDLLRARADSTIAAYRVLQTLGTLVEAPADLKPDAASREVAARRSAEVSP